MVTQPRYVTLQRALADGTPVRIGVLACFDVQAYGLEDRGDAGFAGVEPLMDSLER